MRRLIAVAAIALSALAHLLAPLVSGFSAAGLVLVPVGLIYLWLANRVRQHARWAQWLSFFLMMIGGTMAMASGYGVSDVPSWLNFAIAIFDYVGAAALFALLWSNHAPANREANTASS